MINRGFLLALGLVLGASSLAQSQSVRLIGEHRDWSSYAASEGSDVVAERDSALHTLDVWDSHLAEVAGVVPHRDVFADVCGEDR